MEKGKEKRIAITGGLGFIGVNCLRFWINQGLYSRFTIIDDCSAGDASLLEEVLDGLGAWRVEDLDKGRVRRLLVPHPEIGKEQAGDGTPSLVELEHYHHDVAVWEGLAPMIEGCEAVVHLAAQTGVLPSLESPRLTLEKNVVGSFNLLEACRETGVDRFICASSSAPLGSATPPLHEGVAPRPLSPYGASKLGMEAFCSAYAASYGMKTMALRFSNVYGPYSRHKGSVVALFFRSVLAGCPLTVYGDGGQTRDLLYVEDICQALTLALNTQEQELFGSPLHIATGRETSVNELIARIDVLARESGVAMPEVRYAPPRAGEVVRSFSGIGMAERYLGYQPHWNLDKGLEATWQWFLRRA